MKVFYKRVVSIPTQSTVLPAKAEVIVKRYRRCYRFGEQKEEERDKTLAQRPIID